MQLELHKHSARRVVMAVVNHAASPCCWVTCCTARISAQPRICPCSMLLSMLCIYRLLLQVLQQVTAIDSGSSNHLASSLCEAQSVLLLWLSILILLPFELSTVDSTVGATGPAPTITPLAVTVMDLCQRLLQHPGQQRGRSCCSIRTDSTSTHGVSAYLAGWSDDWD